jgi:hypothetical protein
LLSVVINFGQICSLFCAEQCATLFFLLPSVFRLCCRLEIPSRSDVCPAAPVLIFIFEFRYLVIPGWIFSVDFLVFPPPPAYFISGLDLQSRSIALSHSFTDQRARTKLLF